MSWLLGSKGTCGSLEGRARLTKPVTYPPPASRGLQIDKIAFVRKLTPNASAGGGCEIDLIAAQDATASTLVNGRSLAQDLSRCPTQSLLPLERRSSRRPRSTAAQDTPDPPRHFPTASWSSRSRPIGVFMFQARVGAVPDERGLVPRPNQSAADPLGGRAHPDQCAAVEPLGGRDGSPRVGQERGHAQGRVASPQSNHLSCFKSLDLSLC